MFKQLFQMPLLRPSITNLFKSSEKMSCQCKALLSPAHLLRQETQVHLMKRSYATSRGKSIIRGPMTWGTLGLFLLTGGSCYIYVRHLKGEKEIERQKELSRSIGMAAIGGPFDLVDTEGNQVTNNSFLGKWVLIYFGFCHCPDICPDQLEKMTSIIEKVDAVPNLPNLQPIFITVDPKRDTKEHIKEYIKDFHQNMIGLTGTEEQVKKCCKSYRVYYSAGPSDDDDDYIVDHTIIMYLVDTNGNFSDYYGQNKTIDEIYGSICTKMAMKLKKSS